MQEWIKLYVPKQWVTYDLAMSSQEYKELMALLEESSLCVCGEESEMAVNHWRRNKSLDGLLFYDTEQILGMNMDKVYGVSEIGVLKREWKGHPAGSLVMSVYSRVREDPPVVTVGVAK